MYIGSGRCISTTLLRSKKHLQVRRERRPVQTAEFLRLMIRAFKCSCSTAEKFEPIRNLAPSVDV